MKTMFPRFPLKAHPNNVEYVILDALIKKTSWDPSTYYLFNLDEPFKRDILTFPHYGLRFLHDRLEEHVKKDLQTHFVFLAHVVVNSMLYYNTTEKEEIINRFFVKNCGYDINNIIIRYYIFLEEYWSSKNENLSPFDNKTVLQSFLQRIFTNFVVKNITPLSLYNDFKAELDAYYGSISITRPPKENNYLDVITKETSMVEYDKFYLPMLQTKHKRIVLTYCKFFIKNLQYKYPRAKLEQFFLTEELKKEFFPEFFFSDSFYILLKGNFKEIRKKNT